MRGSGGIIIAPKSMLWPTSPFVGWLTACLSFGGRLFLLTGANPELSRAAERGAFTPTRRGWDVFRLVDRASGP